MLSIGTLKFDGTPRIAVPFRDGMDAGSIERAVREGADIAELRIDEFANREEIRVFERYFGNFYRQI